MSQTFKLTLSADKKTVYVRLGSDAAPAGTDLGTFVHDDAADAVSPYALNHVLFHHIRDILYKRRASDATAGAKHPDGIYNMGEIAIVKYGPTINFEYLTAAAVTRAGAGTIVPVVKYQPQNVNAVNTDFTWVSATPAKATVNAATGVITYVSAGTTVITATHTLSGKTVSFVATMT